MQYWHKKTGAVIDISSVLSSPDWEEVQVPPNAAKPQRTTGKTAPKKNKKAVKPDERDGQLRKDQ